MEHIQRSWSGKTCPERFPATEERTSGGLWKKSRASKKKTLLFLDRRKGNGSQPGLCWETVTRLPSVCWTPNIGACPSAAKESFLSQILEADAPQKYYLSGRACAGILRRAERRGKELPPLLKAALMRQALWEKPGQNREA